MNEQAIVEQDVVERRGIDSPPFEAPVATIEHPQPNVLDLGRVMLANIWAVSLRGIRPPEA